MNKGVCKKKVAGELKQAVLEAVNELGGLERIVEDQKVLLKPNFNTADPPPAASDPEFVKKVAELCYEHGAREVIVGESSTYMANTRKVMEELEVYELEKRRLSVRVVSFDEKQWNKKIIPEGKFLKSVLVPEILGQVDRIILLPCLKTHFQAKFTGALKLAVGLMKPKQRVGLHLKHIQEKIAELNTVFKPNLIIMDARKCFITDGPSSGEVREPNFVLASKNRVAIDIEGIKIIQSFPGNDLDGINPEELTQVKKAIELGVR